MTASVHKLLSALVHGKSPDDYVFTRRIHPRKRQAHAYFRGMWQNAGAHAGVPELLFHDLRRPEHGIFAGRELPRESS